MLTIRYGTKTSLYNSVYGLLNVNKIVKDMNTRERERDIGFAIWLCVWPLYCPCDNAIKNKLKTCKNSNICNCYCQEFLASRCAN